MISQDRFQISTSKAQASQVCSGSSAPSGKSTWWDLAAQGVRMAAGVRAGPGAGLGDRLWRWLDQCKGRRVQSRVYTSRGRRTGRRSLRDTVERRLPVHGHCEREREEQEGELGTERPRQNQTSEKAPFPYIHPLRTSSP